MKTFLKMKRENGIVDGLDYRITVTQLTKKCQTKSYFHFYNILNDVGARRALALLANVGVRVGVAPC